MKVSDLLPNIKNGCYVRISNTDNKLITASRDLVLLGAFGNYMVVEIEPLDYDFINIKVERKDI